MELKLFLMWVIITGVLLAVAKANFYYTKTHYYWWHWRDNNFTGLLYYAVSRLGLIGFILYYAYLSIILLWKFLDTVL